MQNPSARRAKALRLEPQAVSGERGTIKVLSGALGLLPVVAAPTGTAPAGRKWVFAMHGPWLAQRRRPAFGFPKACSACRGRIKPTLFSLGRLPLGSCKDE